MIQTRIPAGKIFAIAALPLLMTSCSIFKKSGCGCDEFANNRQYEFMQKYPLPQDTFVKEVNPDTFIAELPSENRDLAAIEK